MSGPVQKKRASTCEHEVLRFLYLFVSALCVFMVVWILIAPSSWLMGRSELHDRLVLKSFATETNRQLVPKDIVTKYAGHTAIHLTHTLPGAIWAGVIPFQLHPTWRRSHPIAHRVIGYIFISTSFLMTVGVVIICKRGLFFENYFSDLPPSNPSISTKIGSKGVQLIPISLWYSWSACMALWHARKQQFTNHKRWTIRHIGSGIWVALQRVLLTTVYPAFYRLPVSRETQRKVFGEAALLSTIITVTIAEYAVHLVDKINAGSRAKTKSN